MFSNTMQVPFEEDIEDAVARALHTAKEYTQAPYLYLIRNEPLGMWRHFQLDGRGDLLSHIYQELSEGIITEVFVRSESTLKNQSNGPGPQCLNRDAQSALAIPIKVTSTCLAALYLESPEPAGLTVEHQRYLERVASRLAPVLEQANHTQAIRQLQAISQQLTYQEDLQSMLSLLVRQALSALSTADMISLYYQEQDIGQLMRAHMSGHQNEPDVDRCDNYPEIIREIWESDEPLFQEQVEAHSQLGAALVTQDDIKSAAAFPLHVGDKRVGCMFFGYRFHHHFGRTERSILNLFAQLAALAILRASLYDEAERRQRHLDIVSRIAPAISASLNQGDFDIFSVVVKEVSNAFPKADNVCMMQRNDEDPDGLAIIIDAGFYQKDDLTHESSSGLHLTERRGIVNRVLRTCRPANVVDVRLDPDYIPSVPTTRSELCVPIIVNKEEGARYALILESDQVGAFTADDQRLLIMLAEQAAIAIQLETQLKKVQSQEVSQRTAMMAMGLVHDIYSAVASIPGLVDEIIEKVQEKRDFLEPLADLRRNAEVANRLSGRLKEFVVTGRYEPTWIDLCDLIKRTVANCQMDAPLHVTTKLSHCESLPLIMADKLWMEQLLNNLLMNAYVAIPDNLQGVVQIEIDRGADHLLMHIHDNGVGIPADKLDAIFEFGYSTKDGQRNMKGVGLYHCRLIAETHNGKLTVQSERGVGSVFTLRLPLLDPETKP